MSKINDGGPAFPFEEMHTDGTHYHSHPGLSLRDYFAAKAMQGDISSMQAHEDPASAAHHIAARAYAVADAMLKAREEGGTA